MPYKNGQKVDSLRAEGDDFIVEVLYSEYKKLFEEDPKQLQKLSVSTGLIDGNPAMKLEFEVDEQEFYLTLNMDAAQELISAMRDGVRIALGGG